MSHFWGITCMHCNLCLYYVVTFDRTDFRCEVQRADGRDGRHSVHLPRGHGRRQRPQAPRQRRQGVLRLRRQHRHRSRLLLPLPGGISGMKLFNIRVMTSHDVMLKQVCTDVHISHCCMLSLDACMIFETLAPTSRSPYM